MKYYIGNENTYNAAIYIISVEDPVEGGLDGIDNKANQQLGQSTNYLKKFKGDLVVGIGDPVGNYGLTVDSNMSNGTLYFNRTSGSFWKPIVSGNNVSSWYNITAHVTLNVDGMHLNDAGNDLKFANVDYDPSASGLQILDETGKIINLRVGTLVVDLLDNATTVKFFVSDSEMRMNSTITSASGNNNAKLIVKRFSTQTGEYQNGAMIYWNSSRARWELRTEDTNLLNLTASSYKIRGKTAVYLPDYTIVNQTQFDNLFYQSQTGELTTIIDDMWFPLYDYVYIKKGTYTLKNNIQINRNGWKLHCGPGAFIQPDPSILDLPTIAIVVNDATPSIRYKDIDLTLAFDLNNQTVENLIDVHAASKSKISVRIHNGTVGNTISGETDSLLPSDKHNSFDIYEDTSAVLSTVANVLTLSKIKCVTKASQATLGGLTKCHSRGTYANDCINISGDGNGLDGGVGDYVVEAPPPVLEVQ